jgi:hypothetical protein
MTLLLDGQEMGPVHTDHRIGRSLCRRGDGRGRWIRYGICSPLAEVRLAAGVAQGAVRSFLIAAVRGAVQEPPPAVLAF